MKAVIYHSDTARGSKFDYRKLFSGFMENVRYYGIRTVHLTTDGAEGWGDENHYYSLDPYNIVMNREITFCEFLEKSEDDETYWFTEPDARIVKMFPELDGDLCLLFRKNDIAVITPSFRLARKSALPFFHETSDLMKMSSGKNWDGDTDAFVEMWKRIGSPTEGKTEYNGIKIEIRPYEDYTLRNNTGYVNHFKAHSKSQIL